MGKRRATERWAKDSLEGPAGRIRRELTEAEEVLAALAKGMARGVMEAMEYLVLLRAFQRFTAAEVAAPTVALIVLGRVLAFKRQGTGAKAAVGGEEEAIPPGTQIRDLGREWQVTPTREAVVVEGLTTVPSETQEETEVQESLSFGA